VKKGQDDIARYWAEKSQNTIDGIPTNIVAKSRAGGDGQCGAS
jgi:tripartite-type tricarboxylate transporter receptor subunit TctC